MFRDLYIDTLELIRDDTGDSEISKLILFRVFFAIYLEKEGFIPDNSFLTYNLSSLFEYVYSLTPFSEVFKEDLSKYTLTNEDIFKNFLKFYEMDFDINIFTEIYKLNLDGVKQKSDGIYFTPPKIIDYMLENSINPSSKEELINLKILDPSCGTGLFLIKSIDILKKYYDKFNIKNAEDYILNNIYGVDLNPVSVEITKLSVFLKLGYFKYDNIKCGNFLTGDYFDFKFDLVIGNPPYVNIYKISKNKKDLDFYKNNFKSAYKKFDLYVLFIEKALGILKEKGILSYILPDNIASQPYALKIREIILFQTKILKIVDLKNLKIFKNALIQPIIIYLQKGIFLNNKIKIITPKENPKFVLQDSLKKLPDYSIRFDLTDVNESIIKKIDDKSIKLSEICHVASGCRSIPQSKFHLNHKLDDNSKKLLVGKNIQKNHINYTGMWINYLPDELYNPMTPELFENDKIIIRDLLSKGSFLIAFDSKHYYTSHTTSICILKHQFSKYSSKESEYSLNFDLKYVYGFLISKVALFYFKVLLSSGLHVYVNDIRRLPLLDLDEALQIEITNIVFKILKLYDDLYLELDSFYRLLNLDKIPRKLKKYYTLSLDEFKSEVSDINLDVFQKSKDKINLILREINFSEDLLNSKIYSFYDLTGDEIEIIEQYLL